MTAFGSSNSTDLLQRKVTLQYERTSLGEIFRVLMNRYDVAIGLEESALDIGHNDYEFETNLARRYPSRVLYQPKENWISIDAVDQPLEQVLDTIVGQMKYYDWKVNGGVINIFPVEGRDEVFQRMLDLEIAEYTLPDERPIYEIRFQIEHFPEVKAFLKKEGLSIASLRQGGGTREFILERGTVFRGKTLKEFLNQVTVVKRGGWILKRNKFGRNPEGKLLDLNL